MPLAKKGWIRRARFTALFFFFIVAIFAAAWMYSSDQHYLSPDETMNLAFSRLILEHGEPTINEPLLEIAGADIRPRSFALLGNHLVPGTFVTFPTLLGLWGKLAGESALFAFTPALYIAAIAAVWYVARQFGPAAHAVWAAAAIALHPVVLNYTIRGFWHNGAFAFLLVAGAGMLVWASRRASLLRMTLGTFLVSLATLVRPSEAAWVAVFMLTILLAFRPWPRKYWLTIILPPILMLGALLWWQSQVFGNISSFGYNAPLDSALPASESVSRTLAGFQQLFFPFGANPLIAVQRFVEFFGAYGGAVFFICVIGSIVWFRKKDRHRWLAIGWWFSTLWLIVFYGNFSFTETVDGRPLVLGSSYLRYWLPIIVLGAPFIGIGWQWLRERLGIRPRLAAAMGAVVIAIGFGQYLFDPLYGYIKQVRQDIPQGAALRKEVMAVTPADAVVFAGTADKFLYPERTVAGYNALLPTHVKSMKGLIGNNIATYILFSQGERRAHQTQFEENGLETTLVRLTQSMELYVVHER